MFKKLKKKLISPMRITVEFVNEFCGYGVALLDLYTIYCLAIFNSASFIRRRCSWNLESSRCNKIHRQSCRSNVHSMHLLRNARVIVDLLESERCRTRRSVMTVGSAARCGTVAEAPLVVRRPPDSAHPPSRRRSPTGVPLASALRRGKGSTDGVPLDSTPLLNRKDAIRRR